MALKIGTTAISNIKLGTNQIYKAYQGSSVVWDSGITPPTPTLRALKFESSGAQTLGVDTTNLGTITPNFEYSTDDGATWTSWNTANTISFGNGTDLYLRGNNTFLAVSGYNFTNFVFGTSSPVTCSGNIMHLFDYTQDLTTFPDDANFTSRGVKNMFANCSALVSPPELPATGLARFCYYHMFAECSRLSSAPALPATILSNSCYSYMFGGCYALHSTPALPATALADSCYSYMFQSCYNITTIPALPATTLVNSCCLQMFNGCSKIKMSETQVGDYQNEYIFRTAPSAITAGDMFINTGGTFTGTPDKTTYYTSNTIIS